MVPILLMIRKNINTGRQCDHYNNNSTMIIIMKIIRPLHSIIIAITKTATARFCNLYWCKKFLTHTAVFHTAFRQVTNSKF